MTSLFKADQTSPPQWPPSSSEPHCLTMWCRLSLTFAGRVHLFSLSSLSPPKCFRMVFPDLRIWKINFACGILDLIDYLKIKFLIKFRDPDFKGFRNNREGSIFIKTLFMLPRFELQFIMCMFGDLMKSCSSVSSIIVLTPLGWL